MPNRSKCPMLALAVLLAGCASQQEVAAPLPFHVAVIPVTVEAAAPGVVQATADGATEENGAETQELVLNFDSAAMTDRLTTSLQQTFARVSQLEQPDGGNGLPESWLAQAESIGADLVVDATLRFDPQLTTSLNDRFWLNLPLFALGGPATWFVADRSYHCNVVLEARVFDLPWAASPAVRMLDERSKITGMEREAKESSLSLVDRGSFDHFMLSVLVPAGFVGTEANAVPEGVGEEVMTKLCDSIRDALRERREDLARIARVAFHAQDVRVETTAGSRSLVGRFVLKLGEVSELGELRYRLGEAKEFMVAPWAGEERKAPTGITPARKIYAFRIPLQGATMVQLEVEQLDQNANRRTFTYRVGTDGSTLQSL